MVDKILNTKELEDVIWMKFHDKFPNESLLLFKFEPCQEKSPSGIYVFSKWDKYHIMEIDEHGILHDCLETDDFDDLLYNILDIQFFNMYYRVPNTKTKFWMIKRMFINCRLARYIRCKRMRKGSENRREQQYLKWYSMFGDYYLKRWKNESK